MTFSKSQEKINHLLYFFAELHSLYTFEQQGEFSAVNDLRQARFFAIQNFTASRLKARDRFLHSPVMCQ